MCSSGVTSPETLATLPVYINSSKMEVMLSGRLDLISPSNTVWEGIKQVFLSPHFHPDVIDSETLMFIFSFLYKG